MSNHKYMSGIHVNSRRVSTQISLRKKADGTENTGLLFNTVGLTAYYTRQGGTPQAITLATQTVGGAWTSGGFVELDATHQPGVYRVDLPDAMFVSGADYVTLTIVTSNGFAYSERFGLGLPAGCVYRCSTDATSLALASSSITFPSDVPWTNDNDPQWNAVMVRDALAGGGQGLLQIASYVASTRVATLVNPFNTVPTSDSTHDVILEVYPGMAGVLVNQTNGRAKTDWQDAQGQV